MADTLAARLLKLREINGDTREDVADKVGISANTLYRYETGVRAVPLKRLRQLTDHYGCSRLEWAELAELAAR